ncbi:pantetheine-phosphate adenylyltransferase [Williamsia sterculiae]|nr:pantetheine-phosphate adenylyltransferase [Williamsia sterculiae]
MARAVCPGSFDPVTSGHLYVFEQAAARFDELVITVVVNPAKRGMFSIAERMDLIGEVTGHLPTVRVDKWEGLLVDFCRDSGIETIVKGLRSGTDLDYEAPMAQMNRELAGVDTLFLLTDPRFAHVSSSLIKEIAKLHGDVEAFVPAPVFRALTARLAGERQV